MTPLALLLSLALLAPGTEAADGDGTADASEEEKKRIEWELSGQIRFRGEYRDNFNLNDDVNDTRQFWLSRVRLGFDLTIQGEYEVFIQAQDSRIFGEEASTASNEEKLDLHQGYAHLWRNRPWSLRLGRQEWIYGDERLIGAFGWDNVGRSFDGARVRYKNGSLTADGLLAEISNRPNGTGGTTGSQLYSIYVQNRNTGEFHWEGYWLEFDDHLSMPGELGLPGTTRVDAFGGRCVHHVGPFDGSLELVYQSGKIDGDDLDAWAGAIEAGFTFGSGPKTRVFGGYDYATGDESSTDGEREEFFNFFPTNHKHYGYMDLFGWRNIRSYHGGVRFSWDRHSVQAKFHQLSLETPGGPWKSAGGAILGFDPTGGSGRSVGYEIDLNYNWAFMKKAGLQAGYSIFEPKTFAESTRGSDTQHWAYLMFALGF